MRTGACTVQQALTVEAASVLKQSLNLARRRGHAQVTPLHVAATLLSSTSSSSSPFSSSSSRDTSNLLRRACLKSHPHHPASHALQCRALELCFNVALNRLPTTPPPSSTSLIRSHPSLSNALIAALKRAQAHQRRGCIELQQQQQPPQQQQQQQPALLAIKVELEQLIISILDDPSVSRVMREAGFSSISVKNNLEEESSALGQSSPLFFESHKDFISGQDSFWQTHFLKPPPPPELNPIPQSPHKEDLRVVLEVMLRKQGRRSSTVVVVGDSVSISEGIVAELVGRMERGEVPDELRRAHFINLHLSYVHLRLMGRADVDMKVSDLRRKICTLASDRAGGGVVIYAGDLRWAVDEETRDGYGFSPVEHMIAEVGRLLSEVRSSSNNGGGAVSGRVWLLATASYQTYMKCQMRQPSVEAQWALRAVVVPSGGLALSLQAPSGLDLRVTKLGQHPFQMLESKPIDSISEEEKIICCAECTSNFEKEASILKSETRDTNGATSHLPSWLQPHGRENLRKDTLLELKKKWYRLCQSLHHGRHHTHLYPPLFSESLAGKNYTYSSSPWWSSSSPYNRKETFIKSHPISFLEATTKHNGGALSNTTQRRDAIGNWQESDASKKWLSDINLHPLEKPANQDVRTALALASPLFSDTATSKDHRREVTADPRELSRQLQENIPWQSETIPSIVEAVLGCRSSEKKGTWLLIQGTDHIAKRRLARVIAQSLCGSADRFMRISLKTSRASACTKIITEAFTDDPKRVVLIEDVDQDIDRLHGSFVELISKGLRNGWLEDPFGREVSLAHGVFILTTSGAANSEDADKSRDSVVKMKLWTEETSQANDLKRKHVTESPHESKKPRTGENRLDLNLCAEEEGLGEAEEDAIPSDLTHETCGGNPNLPHDLLNLITASFTLDASPDWSRWMSEALLSKLTRAFDEPRCGGGEGAGSLCVDQEVVEELLAASGFFLESLFERWVREVFQMSLLTVKKGGKVRLGLESREGDDVGEFGFQGSVLPTRIHVG